MNDSYLLITHSFSFLYILHAYTVLLFLDNFMEESQQLLDEIVLPDEIQRYRSVYEKAKEANQLTDQNKFSFAYCLVRSKVKADVRTGIQLLRELYDATRNDNAKRDYLYYLALGMFDSFNKNLIENFSFKFRQCTFR